MNTELDTFARTVYEAYGSFRIAGFAEDKAFQLARDFMAEAIRQQLKQLNASNNGELPGRPGGYRPRKH